MEVFNGFRPRKRYEAWVADMLAGKIKGKKIISVGCGEGYIEKMLAERLGIEITGVEITAYKNSHIPVKIYNGKNLPFKKREFDEGIFVYVLHHTTDIGRVLKETSRVIKKNMIILDHFYSLGISKGLLKTYDYWTNFVYKMPVPFNFLKIKEWFSLFRKAGFKVEEAKIVSPLNVMFIISHH